MKFTHSMGMLFGIGLVCSALASLISAAEPYPSAKGYCFWKGKRITMERVAGGPHQEATWQSTLDPTLLALVSFESGFGGTIVRLSVTQDLNPVGKAKLWNAGVLDADSKPDAAQPSSPKWNEALSLGMTVGGLDICCEYNLYLERGFQGDPSQVCRQL